MIKWLEGFDHYGVDSDANIIARMLDGIYNEVNSSCNFVGIAGRVGGGIEYLAQSWIRRNIGGASSPTFGFACAILAPQIPSGGNAMVFLSGRNNANASQFTINVSTTGQILLRTGAEGGTIVAQSATGVVPAGEFFHFEVLVTVANAGSCEVRINGVTVLDVTGVDTMGQATNETTQILQGNTGSGGTGSNFIADDLVLWDTTGTINNDFHGDQKIYTQLPDADKVLQDWAPNSGLTGYTQIDDATPDDATTYIEATVVNDVSEFTFQDLPAEVQSVSGIHIYSRVLKTDAGTGSFKQSIAHDIGSPLNITDGSDHAVTTAFSWYDDVFETDPSTGVQFTPAGLNASHIRLTRTL